MVNPKKKIWPTLLQTET